MTSIMIASAPAFIRWPRSDNNIELPSTCRKLFSSAAKRRPASRRSAERDPWGGGTPLRGPAPPFANHDRSPLVRLRRRRGGGSRGCARAPLHANKNLQSPVLGPPFACLFRLRFPPVYGGLHFKSPRRLRAETGMGPLCGPLPTTYNDRTTVCQHFTNQSNSHDQRSRFPRNHQHHKNPLKKKAFVYVFIYEARKNLTQLNEK